METNQTLNGYIATRNCKFNNFALKLYIENKKQGVFPDDEAPLRIFKVIADKMIEHGSKFFSFVSEIEAYIKEQNLTTPQCLLLYGTVKDYLKAMTVKYSNSDWEYYYDNYLTYFVSLEQVAVRNSTDVVVAATDIPSILNDMVHRQMLKLSTDLDTIPVVEKARVITSIYKAMSTGSKTKKEPTENHIEFTPFSVSDDDKAIAS